MNVSSLYLQKNKLMSKNIILTEIQINHISHHRNPLNDTLSNNAEFQGNGFHHFRAMGQPQHGQSKKRQR